MRAGWLLIGLAGASLALGACGDEDDDTDTDAGTTETETTEPEAEAVEPLTIDLAEQSKSGVTGTVTFTEEEDGTHVLVELEGDTTTDAHPAHIHPGTCATLDPAPVHPLENVEDGSSETVVDATIEELTSEPFAVNVHRSEAEAAVYIACADITSGELVVDLAEQSDSGLTGTATFTEGDDGTTVVVALEGDEADASHPAHVHEGTCAKLNPAPAFPLENVDDGASETTIDATLAQLAAKPYAVNVHASDDDLETYVACGDLTS